MYRTRIAFSIVKLETRGYSAIEYRSRQDPYTFTLRYSSKNDKIIKKTFTQKATKFVYTFDTC